MWRKNLLSVLVVMLLGPAGAVLGATITWTDDSSSDSSWCNANNWNPSDIPGSSDTAVIGTSSPERGPVIGIGCNVDVERIQGPNPAFGSTQVMDINTDGTVTVDNWTWRDGAGTSIINIGGGATVNIGGPDWRGADVGISYLNIGGSAVVNCSGNLRGADESGTFYLDVSGGQLDIGGELLIGDNGGGQINVSDGSITIDTRLVLGGLRGSAPITVNMSGGVLSVGTTAFVPPTASRAGTRMNLYGGVFECGEFVHGGLTDEGHHPTYTDDWRVDIEQGTLKIDGDVRDEIDANVAAGQITAYDGDGTVSVALVEGKTIVTAIAPDPHLASNPYPEKGSRNVERDLVLSWTPGIESLSHDVYFGTSFDDVNDAATADIQYLGNVDVNNYPETGTLELDYATAYYWRIDEKTASQTYKGKVWKFISIAEAFDPNLLVWYKLDEPNGLVAHDSSGYGNEGSLDIDYEEVLIADWNPDNGHEGGYLGFNNDTVVHPPIDVLDAIGQGISFAVWLKDSAVGADSLIFCGGTGGEQGLQVLAAVPYTQGDAYWRAGNDSNDTIQWSVPGGAAGLEGWHFWAFVKDENADSISIYFDGELAASNSGVDDTLGGVKGGPLKIGAPTWSAYGYVGKMDDFMLYNRALSLEEVSTVFRGADPNLAWAPQPFNGQTDVPRDASLFWRRGDNADRHDVYFGTSFDDVNDADTDTSGIYLGRQDANSYDPSGYLELTREYYWRIDEVNEPNLWKGKVWKFTVGDFLVVDAFESYSEDLEDLYWFYGGNWLDGIDNSTGCTLYLGVPPDPAHTGRQSLLYLYQNQFLYYSEAERVINPGERDWTDAGVKMLTLFFYGDPGNDAGSTEQMYAGIKDGGGTYAKVAYGVHADEDMDDIKVADWHEWNIPLTEFNDVTVSNVTNLYIMFGESDNTSSGGSGTVYFDDIRLYLPKCVPAYGPDCDFSGNCIVDIPDVDIMASQWLRTDACLATAAPASSPVGWWKLEEGTGTSCADSSVNGNNGMIDRTGYTWVSGKIGSYALELYGARVLVPDATVLRPANSISVMAWINYSEPMTYSARIVAKGVDENDSENFALQLNSGGGLGWFVRDSNSELCNADSGQAVGQGEWAHFAGTSNGSIVRCYINGQLSGSESYEPFTLLRDTNSLCIGDAVDVDRAFMGKVDDVRVYNVALSDENIAYVATLGSGYSPLESEANVYDAEPAGNKAVNFRDFAKLMTAWLEQKLWPAD